MTGLPDSARAVIESAALAHLVTLNPDGSPQVSCVWVGLDGDEIVCGHLPRHRKVENIERDPRVALSIEGEQSNELGLKHYLVVYGRRENHRGRWPRAAPAAGGDISRPRDQVSSHAPPPPPPHHPPPPPTEPRGGARGRL